MDHELTNFDSKTIWHDKEADGSEPNDIMRTLMSLPSKWPDPKHLSLHLHEIHENGKIYGFMQKSSGSTLVSSSFRDFIPDALVMEESDAKPVLSKGKIQLLSTPHTPKLTWNAAKIAGRHVWVAEYLADRFCVSDEFMEVVEARGDALFRKIRSFVKYIN